MPKDIYVHNIRVTASGEPVNRVISFPTGTQSFSKLIVEVNPSALHWSFIQFSSFKSAVFGQLNMRQNRPGDIFFQAPVRLAADFEENYQILGVAHPGGGALSGPGFSSSGGIHHPWIFMPSVPAQRLEIHYRDVINAQYGFALPYEINLYFTLDR